MRSIIISGLLVLALATTGWAFRSSSDAGGSGSCRARSHAGSVCTLSGETAPACCCIVENGQLVCTLTGEALKECCCKAAK